MMETVYFKLGLLCLGLVLCGVSAQVLDATLWTMTDFLDIVLPAVLCSVIVLYLLSMHVKRNLSNWQWSKS